MIRVEIWRLQGQFPHRRSGVAPAWNVLSGGPFTLHRASTHHDFLLRSALRSRALTDAEFDCVYPPDVRQVSRRFWTPLAVAWRAAAKLTELGVTRVLDVGSGSGKFCVAAAASAPGIAFVGIEHRTRLVETARDVSSRMQTSNARFLVGDATLAQFNHFDALYFFNPFEENTFDDVEQIDGTVELTFGRYMNDVQRVCAALANARIGTIVVTYHGFGARFPCGYKLLSAEPIGSDRVCFWRKASEHPDTRLHAVGPPRASCIWSSAPPETFVE